MFEKIISENATYSPFQQVDSLYHSDILINEMLKALSVQSQ